MLTGGFVNSAEINNWHRIVEPHRKRLDIATIIWFWMSVEESASWEAIEENITTLCSEVIDYSMLYVNLDSLEHAKSGYSFGDGRALTEDEEWFVNYRRELSKVTPFADYYPQDFDGNSRIFHDDEIPEHYLHPVLSNRKLTHSFVNLDVLIDRIHAQDELYPSQLGHRFTIVDSASSAPQAGGIRVGERGDPFRMYHLTDRVEHFLWSGKVPAGEDLKRLVSNIDSDPFNRILGTIYDISVTQARQLRIYTQDPSNRAQGSGTNLGSVLHPLMKVMLFDELAGPKFWSLTTSQLASIDSLLGIVESERKLLLSIARPESPIADGRQSTFSNPGKTKPDLIYRRANAIATDRLVGFNKKYAQLADPKAFRILKQAILEM